MPISNWCAFVYTRNVNKSVGFYIHGELYENIMKLCNSSDMKLNIVLTSFNLHYTKKSNIILIPRKKLMICVKKLYFRLSSVYLYEIMLY